MTFPEKPTMQTMPATQAKDHFGALLNTAKREPVEITSHGRPVAVVLSPDTYRAIKEGGSIPHPGTGKDLSNRISTHCIREDFKEFAALSPQGNSQNWEFDRNTLHERT